MVSTTYTIAAWVLLIGLATTAYLAKQHKNAKLNLKGQPLLRSQPQQQPVEPRPAAKAKKQRAEPKKDKKEKEKEKPKAEKEKPKVEKEKPKAEKEKPKVEEAPQRISNDTENAKETAIDDHEFARQLTSMKTGKKFDRRGDDSSSRQKSVKQSRAARVTDFDAEAKNANTAQTTSVPSEEKVSSVSGVSTPPSSAGADGNDSPSTSPLIAPADTTGVADMLEPAPAGPSILRLVNTEEKPKQTPKTKAEIKESKKARQNRKKAQEAKELREAEEVERKQKLEAQRRLARVSEGRPAQDGSKFMASLNGNKPVAPAATESVQLLDTFEKAPAPAQVKAPAPAAPKDTGSLHANSNWLSSLPSEEEQMEMVKEDAEWSTVKTKSSRKSAKKDAQEAPAPLVETAVDAPAAGTKAPAPVTKPKIKATGSFAALSTNDDEAVEEEWDV